MAFEDDSSASGCGLRPPALGTWVDDARLSSGGLVSQLASHGRGPDNGLYMTLQKELRNLEDKFARQLRRLQEHSERCTDVLLRPLEVKVTDLASRQKAADSKLAELGGDVRGLQDALANHVRDREAGDAWLDNWTKTLESDLQKRCAKSKQELTSVVASGLRDTVTKRDLFDVVDLLKAELPRMAVGLGLPSAQEDMRNIRHGPGTEAKAAYRGAAAKQQEPGRQDMQCTAELLRLLSGQAAMVDHSAKAGILWELEKASEAGRRGLAEMAQRTDRGERALEEVRRELSRVQEDVGHLMVQNSCRRAASSPASPERPGARPAAAEGAEESHGSPSKQECILPGREVHELRELAQSASVGLRHLAADVTSDRRRMEALAVGLAAAERRLWALEESRGRSPRPSEADARRRVARLLERVGASGHAGLGEWLDDLAQRVASLEEASPSESKPRLEDGFIQVEPSPPAVADTEELCATGTHMEGSSAISEAVVLADSLASELHTARLVSEGSSGPGPPSEDDLRGHVAAVWNGLAELADVMSVSCNSLAVASTAAAESRRPTAATKASPGASPRDGAAALAALPKGSPMAGSEAAPGESPRSGAEGLPCSSSSGTAARLPVSARQRAPA